MPRTFHSWSTQLIVCGLVLASAGQASAVGLENAVARAKQTGLPLLVIGSGDS